MTPMTPSKPDTILTSGPWYATLANQVLRTSGPMALITIGFAWFVMWVVWGSLQVIKENQLLIRQDIANASVKMTAFAATQETFNQQRQLLLEKQLAILRQLCVNSSKTETALKACVQ